jgi:hypothetical protein
MGPSAKADTAWVESEEFEAGQLEVFRTGRDTSGIDFVGADELREAAADLDGPHTGSKAYTPRNQGPGTRKALRKNRVIDVPGFPAWKDAEGAELYGLLSEHEAGELAPARVELGELPANASPDMRRVAEHMRLLMGLRLAAGEDRPLPYASRFAASQLGWKDYRRAARAIRKLREAGVIRDGGSLPVRGKGDGTKTYAPPLPLSASTVEDEPVTVKSLDGPAVEPAGEVEDQAAVLDTEPLGGVRGSATSANAAGRTSGHESDVIEATSDHHLDVDAVTAS